MARITTLEERFLINELAEAGYTHREIADQTGWSYSTVRKWLRRGRQGRTHLGGNIELNNDAASPGVIETLLVWEGPFWGKMQRHAQHTSLMPGGFQLQRGELPSVVGNKRTKAHGSRTLSIMSTLMLLSSITSNKLELSDPILRQFFVFEKP